MSGFNLEDYEPVEERIGKFYADHGQGRIVTELIAYSDTSYIVRAEVYRTDEDERPAASGLAQETVSARGVNSTSALENCETSAIGRALANLNYATKGKRPSREEMNKPPAPVTDPAWYDRIYKDISECLSLTKLEALLSEAKRKHAAGECTTEDAKLLKTRYDEAHALLSVPIVAQPQEPLL